MSDTVPASFPAKLPARIAFVGEAPGASEVRNGYPFAGKAGKAFNRMLSLADIIRNEQLVTNVFDFKLDGNDIGTIAQNKKAAADYVKERRDPSDASSSSAGVVPYEDWLLSPVERGKYVKAEYAVPALERLEDELLAAKPNVIVPLGNTALWAVTGQTGVSSLRGSIMESKLLPGVKVIPTLHPAMILRQWKQRPIAIMDLMKVRHESRFPEIKIVTRQLWLEPRMKDMREFKRRYIDTMDPAAPLSVDIETKKGQITCIGFAPSVNQALCVPFVDLRKPGLSYWPTAEEELEAWEFCRELLESPQPKLGQNFTYDWQWILEKQGIGVRNYLEDTKLLHHALYPEMKKDLGLLGSIYLTDRAWKGWSSGKEAKRDA